MARHKKLRNISHLPDECLAHIFTFLSSNRDRCSCAAVAKPWLQLLATMPQSQPPQEEISRCLDDANDTRLAALLVGAHPCGLLTQLCIRCCSSRASYSSRADAPPTGITDSGLMTIAQACPGLKFLRLSNCTRIGSKGLSAVAKSCRALEKLEISNCPSVCDDGLTAVASHCKRLASLSLESCPLVGDRSLMAFAESSSHLTSIFLTRCPLVGDIGIISVIHTLPQLACLKLACLKVGDAVLRTIGERSRQLRMLSMENIWGPSELGYSWIGASEGLDSLSLRSCVGLTARSFDVATTSWFTRVKKLTIGNSASFCDEGLLALTTSTRSLQSLTLNTCSGLSHRGLMQSLTNNRSTLKSLSLVNCNITPTHHQEGEVDRYPLLDTLKLRRCRGITDRFLARMGDACMRAKKVAVVGMGGSVTDHGLLSLLRPFNGMKELESLDLTGCTGITDRSVAAIARACGETLQSLRLRGCEGLTERCLGMIGELCPELRELDLSGCGIGDGGVLELAQAAPPRLQMLSLAGCGGITDAGLGFLELMCAGLEMLDVRCCPRLTQRGIDSVRDTLFWCDLTA